MINLYEGNCESCARFVTGGEGIVTAEAGKWVVLCPECAKGLGIEPSIKHVKNYDQRCPSCGLNKARHLFRGAVCVDCE